MSDENSSQDNSRGDDAHNGEMHSEERPFSVNRGCEGCLASLLFLFISGMLLISGIVQALQIDHLLDRLSVHQTRALLVVNWGVAMFLGGYVAAQRGRTTGWSNALVVGIFGVLFALGQLGREDGFGSGLEQVWREPAEHWQQLAAMAVTIPAALLGGLLWSRRHPS